MKGSSKRFGVRYGRRLRLKLECVEAEQKKKYKCPYCYKVAVKRLAVGIWNCPKCAAVFTGKAYSVPKKPSLESAAAEELPEEMPEEESSEEYAEETEEQSAEEQTTNVGE